MRHDRLRILKLTSLILGAWVILGHPIPVAGADIGPKPEMQFEFEFPSGEDLTIKSGELLQCETAACLHAEPLEELGPQGFSCEATTCRSMAYDYAPYSRLRLEFSDGIVRESNSFRHEALSVGYRVSVVDEGLYVEQAFQRFRPDPLVLIAMIIGGIFFFVAALGLLAIHILRAGQGRGDLDASRGLYILTWAVLVPAVAISLVGFFGLIPLAIPLTLIIEAGATLIYSSLQDLPRREFLTIDLLANIFTVAPFWFLFALLFPDISSFTLMGIEVIIWIVEAGVIYGALRPRVTLRDAIALSFIANAVSLMIGILMPIQ